MFDKEAFTSPRNIVLLDVNTFSFGLMGFGLMGAPQKSGTTKPWQWKIILQCMETWHHVDMYIGTGF